MPSKPAAVTVTSRVGNPRSASPLAGVASWARVVGSMPTVKSTNARMDEKPDRRMDVLLHETDALTSPPPGLEVWNGCASDTTAGMDEVPVDFLAEGWRTHHTGANPMSSQHSVTAR